MAEHVTEAFVEIAALAERLGVSPINQFPGCWEHKIDKRWWIAVNAHPHNVECSAGHNVPPFHAYVQYNGWPAGVINPYGGVMAAGAMANEDAFIVALKAAGRGDG